MKIDPAQIGPFSSEFDVIYTIERILNLTRALPSSKTRENLFIESFPGYTSTNSHYLLRLGLRKEMQRGRNNQSGNSFFTTTQKGGAKGCWRVDGCFPEKCIIFIIESRDSLNKNQSKPYLPPYSARSHHSNFSKQKQLHISLPPKGRGGVKNVNYNFGLLPPVFLSMWSSNQISTCFIVKWYLLIYPLEIVKLHLKVHPT